MWNRRTIIVLALVCIGAVLRLAHLEESPPGINQDEADNAWNAYCLLQTGQDQAGHDWPIFYAHGLGDNTTTLHYYLMMPFQALMGLGVWSTRLPMALFGILAIPLFYHVATRLFDASTGLLAAFLLTTNPWHIHLSRIGLEGGLGSFFVILMLAILWWAGLPPANEGSSNRWIRAALGGIVIGITCYGYPAVRLFIPCFLFALVLVNRSGWWNHFRNQRRSVLAFFGGFFLVFAPLVWVHLTDPAINERGQNTWVWQSEDSVGQKCLKVLDRYAGHYSPRALFLEGDRFEVLGSSQSVLIFGFLFPVMVIGLSAVLWKIRRSIPARILFVWVLLYPLGDSLNGNPRIIHPLRCSPGIGGLLLLASVGLVVVGRWFYHRYRRAFVVFVMVFCSVTAGYFIPFLMEYYGDYPRRAETRRAFHVDLLQACAWLKPRLDEYDAVFITTDQMNQPYIITLVGLDYPPQKWLMDICDVDRSGEFDRYYRYGNIGR